jgi:TatA/E family protein of Tat protein translocase
MFGLGPTELLVIMVLVLVLLGPKKLPEVASGLGKAIRQFRKATGDLTSQLDIDEEVKGPFRELKAALRDEPQHYVPPAAVPVAVVPPPQNTVAVGAPVATPLATTPATPLATTPIDVKPTADADQLAAAHPAEPTVKVS